LKEQFEAWSHCLQRISKPFFSAILNGAKATKIVGQAALSVVDKNT